MNRQSSEPRETRYRLFFAVFVFALFILLVWQADKLIDVSMPRTLVLYCFSAMDDVMDDGILPRFREHWQESFGEEVEFITTYSGSGAITDRILKKFPAEVAILSSELDALQLSRSGIFVYTKQRRELPHHGVFAKSPFVLFVRDGNPKGIKGFVDLAAPGVELLHADPRTSGGGQWAVLSVYGTVLAATGDADQARETLLGAWHNVINRPPSARAMRELFGQGVGDAMITYEQQLLGHPGRAAPSGQMVIPATALIGEHVVVKLEMNISSQQRELVDGFVDFLWSRTAQETLVAYGFRSVQEELNEINPSLNDIEKPITLDDLGGPKKAKEEIIEGIFQAQALGKAGASSP